MSYTQIPLGENRDVINFKEYRRNPLEFLERLEEMFSRNKVNRWHMNKNLVDESFKNITDNWWTAIRNDVHNYPEFKQVFKTKYWSESIQNIIQDNLCNGKYYPTRGQSPTAYCLGKVCLARHLEPRIPEECLVTKLSYHFEEGIVRARLCVQMKTIGAMEALLESYEQEDYYKRNRRRPEIQTERRNEPNQDNRQRVNYVRANNNNRSPPNNRFRGCLLYTSRCV